MFLKIGLCLIAKNESKVIERCLNSSKPLVDFVYVSDTGSSDSTPEIVEKWLLDNKIPGQVDRHNWQDFAYNRTQALRHLRAKKDIDYVLIIDADEILMFEPNFNAEEFKKNLKHDLYYVQCKYNGIEYERTNLFKNKKPYFYKGALHEFLDCSEPIFSRAKAIGFYNVPLQDSFRNQNKQKFLDDAKLLENILEHETDAHLIQRYTFYLAQSYKDFGDSEKSLKNYLKRVQLGGWDEEIWYSYHMITKIFLSQNKLIEAEKSALQGFICYPKRAESFYLLTKYCRENKNYERAYSYYLLGKNIKPNDSKLFVDPTVYEYGFDFEFSIINYYIKERDDKKGKEACLKVLLSNATHSLKEAAKNNLKFYQET